MDKVRVLCIDDDVAQLTVMSGILKNNGYEVDTATNGPDGLKKARDWKPGLIILDIMMPGMDGYEVCRHLKKDDVAKNIAVLMLTAKGGVDEKLDHAYELAGKVRDRLKGFDSGAMEFLTKPVKAKDLLQRVKAILWASGFPV
jgi:two-component system alkaline phosphatase synthesis response regulator PhoP